MKIFTKIMTVLLLINSAYGSENLNDPVIDSIISHYESLKPASLRAYHKINFEHVRHFRSLNNKSSQKTSTTDEIHDSKLLKLAASDLIKGFGLMIKNTTDADIKERFEFFKRECDHYAANNDLTYKYLVNMAFRFTIAISKPSADELDLYKHALLPGGYNKFFKENVWKSDARYLNTLDFNDQQSHVLHTSLPNTIVPLKHNSLVNQSVLDFSLFEKLIDQHLPKSIYYPIANHRFFTVLEVLTLYLQNVYPIALAPYNSQLNAHGINAASGLSNFGHAFHDKFHADLDQKSKRQMLSQHCANVINIAYKHQQAVRPFLKAYMPIAVKKYCEVTALFKNIIDRMVQEATVTKNVDELHSHLGALFLCMHEYPSWSSDMLETLSAEKVIDTITHSAVQGIKDHQSWESPDNILNTLSSDGKSINAHDYQSLNPAQLSNSLLVQTSDQEVIDYLQPAIEKEFKTIGLDADNIYKTQVKRSKRFIDVIYQFRDGQKHLHTIATYHHKLLNSHDRARLLQFMGAYDQEVFGHCLQAINLAESAKLSSHYTGDYLELLQSTSLIKIYNFVAAAKVIIVKQDKLGHSIAKQFAHTITQLDEETEALLNRK